MKRREFLKAASAGAASVALGGCAGGGAAVEGEGEGDAAPRETAAGDGRAPRRRPNILFIFTDDQGWGDLGCSGHPYLKTPNLDRLAAEGTRFTSFYVNSPVCSPTRGACMTGRYPARLGIHGHFADHRRNAARGMPNWLDPDVPTVTRLLKRAGYATAHFGKWHLGGGEGAPGPAAYGIDDHVTRSSSGPQLTESEYFDGMEETRARGYFRAFSTDAMVHETIRFVTANRDRPFYVNLWTLVPHATLKPTPEELAVYEGLRPRAEDFESYMQGYARDARDLTGQMKSYCASVTGMDRALGRLFDKLDALGLANDTLVFFASDNGPEDYQIRNAANAGMGSPGRLRGRKRSIYEGGVRTPCIARWPGRIRAGRVDGESVITGVDWLPTACALAGVPVPDGGPDGPLDGPLDGEDVSDMLTGAPRTRRKPIFWEWRFGVSGNQTYRPPGLAIRDGHWKLLVDPGGGRTELYDIRADPEERANLADAKPEITRRLSERVLAWRKTLPPPSLGT